MLVRCCGGNVEGVGICKTSHMDVTTTDDVVEERKQSKTFNPICDV